ncbi:hypothetical protein BDR04DRAFT_1109847 [Suillus decipiens]|nr:hypothetical protein BDR04DRAFT_1109847 [Suillus decipiens]
MQGSHTSEKTQYVTSFIAVSDGGESLLAGVDSMSGECDSESLTIITGLSETFLVTTFSM